MHKDVLLALLPYVALIAGSVLLLRLLIKWSGARLQVAQVRKLHGDELGGVQSLSFVLTLPLFIIVLMFIVQLSQITIGKIAVEYAAFAASRTAMVWIPASLGWGNERENEVSAIQFVREQAGENGETYYVYKVQEGSPKYDKIHFSAAMACVPVCPSRTVGVDRNHPGNEASESLQLAYRRMAPASANNPRIPQRIDNKLAYALAATRLKIEVWHKEDDVELALAQYFVPPRPDEYTPNEIGWQDQLRVTVTHDFALLPGPGRLLARRAEDPLGTSSSESFGQYGSDNVSRRVDRQNQVWVYSLSATARLSNEGEKSVLSYVQPWYGGPGYSNPSDNESDEGYEPEPDQEGTESDPYEPYESSPTVPSTVETNQTVKAPCCGALSQKVP